MKKFIVSVREVHVQGYAIEAKNKDDAISRIAHEGEGDILEDRFEYSHTLDPETWTVEETKD